MSLAGLGDEKVKGHLYPVLYIHVLCRYLNAHTNTDLGFHIFYKWYLQMNHFSLSYKHKPIVYFQYTMVIFFMVTWLFYQSRD